MCKIGIAQGVKGLDELRDSLEIVWILIYECEKDITLEKYEKLDELQRLKMLLDGSTKETIVKNFKVLLQKSDEAKTV